MGWVDWEVTKLNGALSWTFALSGLVHSDLWVKFITSFPSCIQAEYTDRTSIWSQCSEWTFKWTWWHHWWSCMFIKTSNCWSEGLCSVFFRHCVKAWKSRIIIIFRPVTWIGDLLHSWLVQCAVDTECWFYGGINRRALRRVSWQSSTGSRVKTWTQLEKNDNELKAVQTTVDSEKKSYTTKKIEAVVRKVADGENRSKNVIIYGVENFENE